MNIPDSDLVFFCQRHHIVRLSIFGSTTRGEERPDSDLDMLVEFDPNHIPGFLALAEMEIELSRLLGRKVDLRTPEELSMHFRHQVLQSARLAYAA